MIKLKWYEFYKRFHDYTIKRARKKYPDHYKRD